MSVLVQMRVKVPDVERFIATSKRFDSLMEEMGAKNQALYQAENDPSEVTSMSEWDSNDGHSLFPAGPNWADEG